MQTNQKTLDQDMLYGIKLGLPAALGCIPIAITFGLLAKNSGLSTFQGSLMSTLVFAGASQFVAMKMLNLGAGWVAIVLTTFILNFRHFLMSMSLSQRLKIKNQGLLWIIAFGLTDESFALASMEDRKILPYQLVLGLNFTVYFAWVIGTFLGFIIADALPTIIEASLGIALYAMFIGILIPSIKKFYRVGLIASLGAIFNFMLQKFFAGGWSLVIAAILASLIGTIFFEEV